MGCGCNKKVPKQKPVSKTKEVLRKMWKKSQTVVKPLNVKEINKP
mgnify:CR=1 FL=1